MIFRPYKESVEIFIPNSEIKKIIVTVKTESILIQKSILYQIIPLATPIPETPFVTDLESENKRNVKDELSEKKNSLCLEN